MEPADAEGPGSATRGTLAVSFGALVFSLGYVLVESIGLP